MANYDDRLKDYVDVKERIRLFYERFPDGRLVTDDIWMVQDADGTVRVWGRALAYRTPDDPLPGKGTSYMAVPGTTPYTRGSEAENVETSCWGRAIGSLGIGIDKSIASAQEVQNKQEGHSGWVSDAPFGEPIPETTHDDGLIGTVEQGKPPVDLNLRQTPDGAAWGFKLKNGRRSFQVLAKGDLADAIGLALVGDPGLEGEPVQVWGSIEMIPWNKGDRAMPPFPRVNLTRIKTPRFELPAPDALTPEERALVAGSLPDEAPSEELGLLV